MRSNSAPRARSRIATALVGTALVALSASALPACARATRAPPELEPLEITEAEEGDVQGDAPLAIDNRNWSDIVVIVIRNNGQRTRIGTVGAAAKSTLRLPATIIAGSSTIQLVARPIGGWGEFRSERFIVLPGQQVTWTLEHGLERSSLAVY